MADPTENNADIPRYLRYKADDKNSDDYWDEEIERANYILHERVLRMTRDKLCVNCARFDWVRTQSYNRFFKDTFSEIALTLPGYCTRPLTPGIMEWFYWNKFKLLPGVGRKSEQLNESQHYDWKLGLGREQSCTFCSILTKLHEETFSVSDFRSGWDDARQLTVAKWTEPMVEHSEGHRCRNVSG